MRLTTVLLADYASVREGLLHVIGGGINIISRSKVPCPLDATIAVVVAPETLEDMERQHELRIEVQEKSSQDVIGIVAAKWAALSADKEGDIKGDSPPSLPIAIPLRSIRLRQEGPYVVELSIDGKILESLQFELKLKDS